MSAGSPSDARVTVVVPTRDRPDYLLEAVRSILAQTAPGIAVVVVDNGSARPVAEVLHEVRSTVRVIRREGTLGSVGNIDLALHLPETEFAMVFHDDDTMHPRLIETQLALFDRHPELLFIGAGYRQVTDATMMATFAEVRPDAVELYRGAPDLVAGLMRHGKLAFPSVLYRRSALEGRHLDGERFAGMCDRPFLADIAIAGPTALLLDPWLNYRIHAAQDSQASYVREEHLVALLERYRSHVVERSEHLSLWRRYATDGLLDTLYAMPPHARPSVAGFIWRHLRAGRIHPTAIRRRGLSALTRVILAGLVGGRQREVLRP